MNGYCDRCGSVIECPVTSGYYVCRSCGFSNGSMGRTDGGSSVGGMGYDGSNQSRKEWKTYCGSGITINKDYTKDSKGVKNMKVQVKNLYTIITNYETEETLLIGDCPSCGLSLNEDYNYCRNCGQELDWSL